MNSYMSDECDCGYCGRCRDQVEYQRKLENTRGYGVDYWCDDLSDEQDKEE